MSHARRVGDDQPLRHTISELPPIQRAALVSALKPTILQRFRDLGDDPAEAEAETRTSAQDLRFEDVPTTSSVLTFVQGWGTQLCGGTGNCSLWVLDANRRILLYAAGDELLIESSVHHGYPDLMVGTHSSAFLHELTWYRFTGVKYKPSTCADHLIDSPPGSKERTEFHTCAAVP